MIRTKNLAVVAGLAAALMLGAAPVPARAETASNADAGIETVAEQTYTESTDQQAPTTVVIESWYELHPGESQQLKAIHPETMIPYTEGVTWSSSDESILTVSPTGELTAVAPGTADVTVSYGEGSYTVDMTVYSWEDAANEMLVLASSPSETGFEDLYYDDGVTVVPGDEDLTNEDGSPIVTVAGLKCEFKGLRKNESGSTLEQAAMLRFTYDAGLQWLAGVQIVSSDESVVSPVSNGLNDAIMNTLVFNGPGTATLKLTATFTNDHGTFTTTKEIPVTVTGEAAQADPQQATGTATNAATGVKLNVTAGKGVIESVVATDQQASNTVVSAGSTVLGTFEVKGTATDCDLTFMVGTEYAGRTARVFIQHDDGMVDLAEAQIAADGSLTIHTDRLSLFTVVVEPAAANEEPAETPSETPAETAPAETKKQASVKTADTLPQTGDASALMAGLTSLAGAGAVAWGVSSRRRAK